MYLNRPSLTESLCFSSSAFSFVCTYFCFLYLVIIRTAWRNAFFFFNLAVRVGRALQSQRQGTTIFLFHFFLCHFFFACGTCVWDDIYMSASCYMYVSAYRYMYVSTIYICPHTAVCLCPTIMLHRYTAIYVSAYSYIRVRRPVRGSSMLYMLYMCPHTPIYVSSYL